MILHRSLLTALLAVASSMHASGQAPPAPPAPAPVPAPVPLSTPAPAPSSAQPAAQTPAPTPEPEAPSGPFLPFKNASFEEPVVAKRTVEMEKANPARVEASDWGHFVRRKGEGEGALNIGMTNEIARTGKQAIFLDFADIAGKGFRAHLMTHLIPVKPQHAYKAGMWGRLDKARPLTLDQRRPYLRMEFEFYQMDEETQVGDTEYRVMRIPGGLKKLLFTSSRWNEAYGIVRAPLGAALMKVSYVFNIPNEPGKTDGTIFFDDAFFEELPVGFPIEASEDITVETGDDDDEEMDDEDPQKPIPLSPQPPAATPAPPAPAPAPR